jgi:hypothetical protein
VKNLTFLSKNFIDDSVKKKECQKELSLQNPSQVLLSLILEKMKESWAIVLVM